MEGTLLSRCPCSNLPSPSIIPYPACLPLLHPMIFEFRKRLWAALSHKLGVLHNRLLLQFSSVALPVRIGNATTIQLIKPFFILLLYHVGSISLQPQSPYQVFNLKPAISKLLNLPEKKNINHQPWLSFGTTSNSMGSATSIIKLKQAGASGIPWRVTSVNPKITTAILVSVQSFWCLAISGFFLNVRLGHVITLSFHVPLKADCPP